MEVLRALQRKGFQLENRNHVFCYLWVGGKKTPVYTKVSHGSKECGSALQSCMAHQLHLSNSEFEDLMDCPLSYETYVAMLRRQGQL